jgi:hypothetical protein
MAATDQTVVVANHPRIHTGPRLHPTQCRLFRRVRVLVAHVLAARDRIKIKARPVGNNGFQRVKQRVVLHKTDA